MNIIWLTNYEKELEKRIREANEQIKTLEKPNEENAKKLEEIKKILKDKINQDLRDNNLSIE
jgi:chaperonin cofactor prefoldin